MSCFFMLFVILMPAVVGILLPILKIQNRTKKLTLIAAALVLECAAAVMLVIDGGTEVVLFSMTATLTAVLRPDSLSVLFILIAAVGFLLAGLFAFRYMQHSEREDSFFAFFLLSEAALMGMDQSANLITMYLFFEMVTLLSMPMVLHDRTQESVRAALKYLFYSIAGAFLALCCIFFLAKYCTTLSFVPGGTLSADSVSGHETLLLVVILLGIIGFGAKAGMYPLHGWLPTAHPVAPAPASAVLSALITKAGVLAIIRVLFYTVGAAFLRGTWVQTVLLCLSLLTVFMGSMMAYREKHFKKRLAYSSVSQISYVLTGLFLLTEQSIMGGLLHILFHAMIKICLFLTAGSLIFNTDRHYVEEYRGCGKSMPITTWSFTLASLALIGIPPASGFVSKWYLCVGALSSDIPVFSWLAPVVLLVSALLTAGYLLPITIHGFFPGKDFSAPERTNEGGVLMWGPIAVLAAITLLLGIFAGAFAPFFSGIAASLI